MVKVAHLDDAFSKFFELKSKPCRSLVNHCHKKMRKGEKGKAKKIRKKKKPLDIGHFLIQRLENLKILISAHYLEKNCSKRAMLVIVANAFFSRLELHCNLAHFQPENRQNVQKCVFGKKLWGSMD